MIHAGPSAGQGLLKTIIAVAFLAVLVAIGVQTVPAFFNNSELSDYIRDQAVRAAVERSPAGVVQSEVLHYAQEMGLPLKPDEVEVTSAGGTVRIEVNYWVQVNLGVGQWKLHFTPSALSRAY